MNELYKTCNACELNLTIEHFAMNASGKSYQSTCRNCYNKRIKERRIKFKLACLEYLNTDCCSKCGYKKSLAALEFHHIDPSQKAESISKFFNVGGINENTIYLIHKELDKCIVLCSNCHKELEFAD